MSTTLGFKITADATQAERAVAGFAKKSSAYIGSIGSELKGQLVGAFAAGAVISAVRSFGSHIVETVDNVKDLSDQLGISTDDVQRLQKAANDAGVGFSKISVAMQRIEALKAQAAGGDKNALGIFSALGIDPTQGTSLDILTKAIDAGTLGGKSAAMFDLLGNKAAILKGVMAELKAQGPITLISPDQINAIDQANLKLAEAKRQLTAQAAGPFAGVLRGMAAQLGALQDPKAMIGGVPGALLTSGIAGLKAAFFGGNTGTPGGGGGVPSPNATGTQTASLSAATAAPAINLASSSDAMSRIGLFAGPRPTSSLQARDIASNTAATARGVEKQTKILRSIEELFKDSL